MKSVSGKKLDFIGEQEEQIQQLFILQLGEALALPDFTTMADLGASLLTMGFQPVFI